MTNEPHEAGGGAPPRREDARKIESPVDLFIAGLAAERASLEARRRVSLDVAAASIRARRPAPGGEPASVESPFAALESRLNERLESVKAALSGEIEAMKSSLSAGLDAFRPSVIAPAPAAGAAGPPADSDERIKPLEAKVAILEQAVADGGKEIQALRGQAQKAKGLETQLASVRAALAEAETASEEELKGQRAVYESRLRQLKAQLDALNKKSQEESARAKERDRWFWTRWFGAPCDR